MVLEQISEPAGRATMPTLLPEDLAEWQGAVELTRASRSSAGGDPLGAVYLYALARGLYGAEDILRRSEEDRCLHHLAGGRLPAPEVLRRFRRDHRAALAGQLTGLITASVAAVDGLPRLGFEPAREAARRLRLAVAADSLAAEP